MFLVLPAFPHAPPSLTAAVSKLVLAQPVARRHRRERAPTTQIGLAREGGPDIGALLARLMDFRGSVLLAHWLQDQPPAAAPHSASDRAGRVSARCTPLLRSIEDSLLRTFQPPALARYRLPDEPKLFAALDDCGVLANRTAANMNAAACSCWEPWGAFTHRALGFTRASVQELRDDLAPELRGLSPLAAELERLDRVLWETLKDAVSLLFDRLPYALENRFCFDFVAAVKLLPVPITESDLAPWLAPSGWIPKHLDRTREAILATFEFERTRLQGLVQAACYPPGN